MVKYLEGGRYGDGAAETGSPRLLIVDDHRTTGLTLKAIFERQGYQAEYAPDVDKAKNLIGKNGFHVAILDLHLDDGSGPEVLRELRQRQPYCKVVILTGYPSEESYKMATQQGAVAFLVKPCDLDELKSIVRSSSDGNSPS